MKEFTTILIFLSAILSQRSRSGKLGIGLFIATVDLYSPASALKCFEEGDNIRLDIVNCAFFAIGKLYSWHTRYICILETLLGNTQVCYTKRFSSANELISAEEDDYPSERGCQYFNLLGKNLHFLFC